MFANITEKVERKIFFLEGGKLALVLPNIFNPIIA
jgi:hypothetical protein